MKKTGRHSQILKETTEKILHSQILPVEIKRENTVQVYPANQKILRDHGAIFAKF